MGFLDQVKQGGQRAAWEAERMVRVNKASGAVTDAKRELETQVMALGRAVLTTYDAGAEPNPEVAPVYQQIKGSEEKLRQLEQEVERIKAEQPPVAPAPLPQPTYAPPPPPAYGPSPGQPGYGPPPGQPNYGPPPGQPSYGSQQPPTYGPPPGPPAYGPPPSQSYTPTGPQSYGPPPGPPAYGQPPDQPYRPTGPADYSEPTPDSLASIAALGDAEDPAGSVLACANCGAERKDPSALFCQECGTRYE